MSEPVIVLNHLSKSFGDVHAVEDLSFTIAPGVIFGFLGANGAGKTTTIRMLCGLTHATSGSADRKNPSIIAFYRSGEKGRHTGWQPIRRNAAAAGDGMRPDSRSVASV